MEVPWLYCVYCMVYGVLCVYGVTMAGAVWGPETMAIVSVAVGQRREKQYSFKQMGKAGLVTPLKYVTSNR